VPLFVPGDRPERFAKAVASAADAVILDLEDAVAAGQKTRAREAVVAFLESLTPAVNAIPVWVRINARSSVEFDADLAAISGRASALMLPKTESPEDVAACGDTLPVIVLIESARGLAGLDHILAARSVCGAAFGSLDYALDLGCAHERDALLHARSELVFRCRLAGLPAPLDGVTTRLDDAALIEADAAAAKALGFGGKLAIHPKQIAAIQAAFRPDARLLAWARAVLQAASSGAATKVDGAMVDAPLIERARRLLALVDRA
jgi:citrate lyase subunit beta/citryl-CoA lyase